MIEWSDEQQMVRAAVRELARTPHLLVASDYDGTLSPIVENPAQAPREPPHLRDGHGGRSARGRSVRPWLRTSVPDRTHPRGGERRGRHRRIR